MTDEPTGAPEIPDARSAERLRLAVDAAGMGEWDWDIVTGELVWSRQCRALYGLPPDGPVDYDRFLRALHPEDRDHVDAALKRAVEERGVYDEEKRCIWPDGSVHWTASRAQVYCDETGRPIRMTGVTFDITERKRAAEQLRAREAELRLIVDHVPAMIAYADRAGRLRYANRALVEFFIGRTTRIDGKPLDEVYGPVNAARARPLLARALAGETLHEDTQRRRWDGVERRVDVTLVPNVDHSGEVAGVFVFIVDVTERRESEEIYRLLAENSNDLITLRRLDGSGSPAYASPSFLRLLGQPAGETVEQVFERIHPDDREACRRAWQSALAGTSGCLTFRHRHANGTWIWLEAWGTAVEYKGERHVLSVARDVTERRRLEEVNRQAQKMEAIGRLAGGVVHDFNNLLTVIIVYSDLLRGQVADNAAAVADLEEIRHAAERARGVTRQLLALSRRGVPKMQVLDVNTVLRANERMLRLLVREDIEFEIRAANRGLPVRADPLQIEQVLLNLVVNARDATHRGGTIIVETSYIKLTAARADVAANVPIGRYARLTVRDTGTGMTAEVAARAFEPFFTTKSSESGTGLGLSTVAETVKQMDGYVWAESKPGHGSAFTVLVPLTHEKQEAAAVQTQVPDREALQGLKVALVEDEDPLRRFVADALRRHGVEVLEFANASEAMPALTTPHVSVDVLLTDVILPGMSGPELVQRVTAVHPDLKILYMSGYAPEEFGFAELTARAPVLKKPFHADELFEHVLMCAG